MVDFAHDVANKNDTVWRRKIQSTNLAQAVVKPHSAVFLQHALMLVVYNWILHINYTMLELFTSKIARKYGLLLA